ncbi:MAG: hypothetical protein H0V17_14075 [Deltaproteobacteria bacterium]|nr:hypothetical protein [Deltaproteobacteria bacterium]
MTMIEMLMFAMIQWGAITAVIARSKNRDVAAWFALGAVLPVIGLLMAIMAEAKPRASSVATA